MSLLLAQIGGGGAVTHATSGALAGQGSAAVGAAFHSVNHQTSGALSGPGSAVAGTSNRVRAFGTSGALTGHGSAIVGNAARTGAAVVHDTSGELAGAGSEVSGSSSHQTPQIIVERGDGVDPKNAKREVKKRDRKLQEERLAKEKLRELIATALDPVKDVEQVEVVSVGDVVQVTSPRLPAISIPTPPRFDSKEVAAEVGRVLESIGIKAQQAAKESENLAIAEEAQRVVVENMRIRLKRRREEEVMLLM